jgi:hypothetical protein
LIPLVKELDAEFGEENIRPSYYHQIKGDGPGIHVHFKYYDSRRKAYRLQAKKGNAVQYFYLRLDEGCEPDVERFAQRYK